MLAAMMLSFRLYMSSANADGCLAVFHASYIDACLQAGDMGKVCLGEYYLPPAEMLPGHCCHSLYLNAKYVDAIGPNHVT